jgi:hypothetical protein
MLTVREHLKQLGACPEAMVWLGDRTARQAWDECERPDWLLWWAGRTPVNDKVPIVRAACDIARTVLHLAPAGDDRPRLAIEAAERWCAEPSAAASDAASDAAWAAARAARAASDAARAAAWAASAAAWDAASDASDVACSAVRAATSAASDAAWAEYCTLIRTHLALPWEEPTNGN